MKAFPRSGGGLGERARSWRGCEACRVLGSGYARPARKPPSSRHDRHHGKGMLIESPDLAVVDRKHEGRYLGLRIARTLDFDIDRDRLRSSLLADAASERCYEVGKGQFLEDWFFTRRWRFRPPSSRFHKPLESALVILVNGSKQFFDDDNRPCDARLLCLLRRRSGGNEVTRYQAENRREAMSHSPLPKCRVRARSCDHPTPAACNPPGTSA